MKILKKILIALVIIIAIPLIAAIFIKKDFAVEREIVINKPKDSVFNYIKYLKNQDHFSKWAQMDPNMKKGFSGTDGAVGAVSTWDSAADSVGKGEQEIKKIAEGDRIDYELRFLKPFKTTNYAFMSTEAISGTQTKVKWGFNGKMDYPFNLMTVCCNMDKQIGGDLQIGLNNLKAILEK